jgi:hypothetical protein
MAGDIRSRLLRAVAELRNEVAASPDGATPEAEVRSRRWPEMLTSAGVLSEENERLVTDVSDSLARLAEAARTPGVKPSDAAERAVLGAVAGAEFVMRSEVLNGRADRLGELLPSFVFLVTLPVLGKEEALKIAGRAEQLLDGGDAGATPP